QKRTRTSTSIQTPAPEAGASTNSAIWATDYVRRALSLSRGPVNAIQPMNRVWNGETGVFEQEKQEGCADMRLVYQGAGG
ncbi:MAG: hypothetical protein ABF288_09765, partial [Octadecabacter sp.]